MEELGDVQIARVDAPLRRQVEDTLRAAIVEGRFKPGERLVEGQLCERLSVSRPLVREALRQLVAECLVTVVPHHGARVASVNSEEARQIYEVRAQLEGLAGRGFAKHADAAALDELKSVVSDLEQTAAGNSQGRSVLEVKQRFYAILLAHCGNQIVRECFQSLNNRISLLRALSLSQEGRLAVTVREIRRVVAALELHDPAAAYKACVAHVESAAEHALTTLREREQGSKSGSRMAGN